MALTQQQIDELDQYYTAPADPEAATQKQIDQYIDADKGGYLNSTAAQNDLAASAAGGPTAITISPKYKQVPSNTPESNSPSFWQDVVNNAKGGAQDAADLLSGNYVWGLGPSAAGPKEATLQDKLLKGLGDDPSIANILKTAAANIGDTNPSDFSGAVMEKMQQTPEGKMLGAMTGLNPVWNTASTAIGKYAIPEISKITGIHPDNLAMMGMGMGTLGLKGASRISDPTVSLVKSMYNTMGENSGASPSVALGGVPAIAGNLIKGTRNIARGVSADTSEGLQDTAAAMKSSAGDIYNQMRQQGAVFNSNKANSLMSTIDNAVTNKQFIPALNPKTLAIVEHIRDAATNGDLSLGDLDQYRRLLSRIGGSEDGVSAGAVRAAIDDSVNNTTAIDLKSGSQKAIALLNKGRTEYARAARFERVAEIVANAAGDPNKIKTALQRFTKNDADLKKQGFTPAEVKTLKAAAKMSVGDKLAKALGRFGVAPDNVFLPAIGGGLATSLGGGPLGGAAVVAGTAARQAFKYGTRGKAQAALNTIADPKLSSAPVPLGLPKPQLALPAPNNIGNAAISGGYGATLEPAEGNKPQLALPAPKTSLTPQQISELDSYFSSQAVPADIAQDEGLRHAAYMDTTGHKTIGYGFNMDSKIAARVWKAAGIQKSFDDVYDGKEKLSDAEANALGHVSTQIAQSDAADVYDNFPKLSQSRQAALTNLSYNLGKGSLANLSAFNSAVNKGSWTEAVRQLLLSKYATQNPVRMREIARGLLSDS